MSDSQSSTAQFVENALASILSAPHISIRPLRGPTGIPIGGPGPVDLFTTKFNNTFTDDASGIVDGQQVDRDGIKQKLLALQTHYNADTATFGQEYNASSDDQSGDVTVFVKWSDDKGHHHVVAGATVINQNGQDKISFLALKAPRNLFAAASDPQ